MATTSARSGADVRPWTIAPPDPEELARISPDIRYASVIDSVFVYLYGADRPAVGLVMDSNLTVMVDPETDKLLGFEIDHFLAEAVIAHPSLEPLLDLPGMPQRRVRQVRRQLDPAKRRNVAIGQLIEQIVRPGATDGGMQVALP